VGAPRAPGYNYPTSAALDIAELIASRLREAGVRRAYGFPGGGSNLALIDAFAAARIEWVLAHSETGAGFMACAEGELLGVPGVLVVGNGPGLTSAVNAVAHAALDRVPLVVISDRSAEATTGHQVLDQRALLAPLVKFGATVNAPGFAETLERALAVSLEHPRGPVHLDMPRDCAHERVASGPARVTAPRPVAETVLPPGRRPVILVGLEATSAPVGEPLVELAHRIGAAVLTTYKAKGVYPERDERWAGILTGGVVERPVLDAADVVLGVGLDPVELLANPSPLHVSLRAEDGPLEALLEALRAPDGDGFTAAEIATFREDALQALRLRPGELTGWQVVETLNAFLPEATTLTVDAGAHMFPATMFARARRVLISNGLATMGFAVPAAIGAALARPADLVVALTGDGGLAYHLAELETVARVGARIIVVVFNDASLSLIRIKHEANGRPRAPLDFTASRFDVVAEGLGVRGARVSDVEQLRAALADAVASEQSTLIDVRLSGAEYGETLRAIRG
jgi:acetolactate synthase-1/2/3 large subunit